MTLRMRAWRPLATAGIIMMGTIPGAASAYLFWNAPDFSGPVVKGDEPGITVPLPGATPAELRANLVWTLRAALNVAALQCQFSTPLMTVRNYNSLLSQHGKELAQAYSAVGGYFKRTGDKKNWQRAFDAHTTRTYNGMSTLHGQIGFCETASKVGGLALGKSRGEFYQIAEQKMSEIRNSLVPAGDRMFRTPGRLTPVVVLPPLDDKCWDRKGYIKSKCVPATARQG